jgi:hypothetical protein
MTSRTGVWASLIGAGIVSLAPAMWWIGTALPTEVSADRYADYMWKPIVLADRARHAIGICAVAIVMIAAIALAQAIRGNHLRPQWLGVLLPVAAVFAYAGAAYSVVTTPVSGANIGGGLALLAAGPFVVAMFSVAVIFTRRLRRARVSC